MLVRSGPVPTAEQAAIVEHDPSRHATVLAVAGSGKTTAMVHRIRFLVDQGVPAAGIRAVMYNRAAREDFARKLGALGIDAVPVQTFHSTGHGILGWAQREGHLRKQRLVSETREQRELARRAIEAVLSETGERRILDVDEVLTAISTWKSTLTPPEEAHHLTDPLLEAIYREFEQIRQRSGLILFDDLIYDAVRLLERDEAVRQRLANRLEHVVIDEFQDVNHARLRLAKILAGERARVMVVGDDDQCIYEWQGARSSFIKRGFVTEFAHHPHSTYKLTRSFRFGPAIAQVAANVVGHNTDRVDKDLVANDISRPGRVTLEAAEQGGGVRRAVPCLQELLQRGVRPDRIAVLVRKHSQAYLLQSLLLARQVPFFVEDQQPLRDAFPVRLALLYLEAADGLELPLTTHKASTASYVVHRPSRFVKRASLDVVLRDAVARGQSLAEVLDDGTGLRRAGLSPGAVGKLRSLHRSLRAARDGEGQGHDAGRALEMLLDRIPFDGLFRSFEGPGAVEDDLAIMRSFAVLLREARVALSDARAFLDGLDSRLGRPDPECVRITTVFKAKGLEWDHVLLPDLVEGQTPDLRATVNVCVNRDHPGRTPDPTETLESERRLFYVAVTRARESLHLFADPDDRRPLSRFVHEACVGETAGAVEALQRIAVLGRRTLPDDLGAIERGASADERLREGLLKMLRRAAQEAPDTQREALAEATLAVNRISARPFGYPRAYAESKPSRQAPTFVDTGLPF